MPRAKQIEVDDTPVVRMSSDKTVQCMTEAEALEHEDVLTTTAIEQYPLEMTTTPKLKLHAKVLLKLLDSEQQLTVFL